MADFRSVNAFALSTYVLAVVAWIVAFAGSIAAKSTLSSSFPRFSWWGLVFQLLILIAMPLLYMFNMFHYHIMLLMCCLAIAFVYNSNSTNNLVYYSHSSTAAAAAGFIITCIVNVLWLVYFGSDPDSPAVTFLDSIGSNENLLDRSRRLAGGSRSASSGYHFRKGRGNRGGNAAATAATGAGAATGANYRHSVSSDEEDDDVEHGRDISSNSYTVRGNDTMSKENNPFDSRRNSRQQQPYSQELSGLENTKSELNGSDNNVASKRASAIPTGAGANLDSDNRYSVVTDSDYPILVRGLYDYTASPDDINELTFKKGECFKVKDTSGNWWQGKNSRGQVGMCPSNYLEVIN